MPFDSSQHHRRSIRLKGFNYATEGAYFVTICTQGKEMLLEAEPIQRMVQQTWEDLSVRFSDVRLDEFVIMPNHVHGIVWIMGDNRSIVGAAHRGRPDLNHNINQIHENQPLGGRARGPAPTVKLFDIVHWFKSMTTARYRHGVYQNGWTPFPGRLWQRNYYERVIRNERELNDVRQYIIDNPKNWENDPEK